MRLCVLGWFVVPIIDKGTNRVTFCLAMKVKDGLVAIADTRVTSGSEIITARKVTVHRHKAGSFFVMTSGLRSLRDKAMTYFEEETGRHGGKHDRLYKLVNAFADQVRRVAEEDRDALKMSGLEFDIHCLIGGQMRGDTEHKLYLLYPQGNWIEVQGGTPYAIIGATGYGKPVLDRTLTGEGTMPYALKIGCLAFDSTRISAADVDFPIDVTMYFREGQRMVEKRFVKEDLAPVTNWWQEWLRNGVRDLPADCLDDLFIMGQSSGARDADAPEPLFKRRRKP